MGTHAPMDGMPNQALVVYIAHTLTLHISGAEVGYGQIISFFERAKRLRTDVLSPPLHPFQ